MGVKAYEEGFSRRFPGQMLLKDSSKMNLWTPSYRKGITLMRTWGTMNPDGTMRPWRDEGGSFGTGFFIQDDVFVYIGMDGATKFTLFSDVEDTHNWPGGSPIRLFYNDMKNHPDTRFSDLTKRQKGSQSAPLEAPKSCGFIKGVLLACGGNDYQSDPRWGVILRLPTSAKMAFDQLLCTENDGASGLAVNDNNRYVVGDPIGLDTGNVFEFHDENKMTPLTGSAGTAVSDSGTLTPSSQSNQARAVVQRKTAPYYSCQIYPNMPTVKLPAASVIEYDEPFEECMNYLTGAQQIDEVIVPGFGRSCREGVLYTFGGRGVLPDWFEKNRATVDMGANTANDITPAPTPAARMPAAVVPKPVQVSAPAGSAVVLPTTPVAAAAVPTLAAPNPETQDNSSPEEAAAAAATPAPQAPVQEQSPFEGPDRFPPAQAASEPASPTAAQISAELADL